ncbi:MAG: HPF/RaiA family ribosome-associated protein [Candidatus Shapirobacteria bacterium]
MHLHLTSRHFEITPKIEKLIEQKITEKIEPLISHFAPEFHTASLHLEQQSHDKEYYARFDMILPPKVRLFAKSHHRLLSSALVDLSHEIRSQITKVKASQVNYSL